MSHMSQVMEDMTKLVKLIPQDRMQNRMLDVPVPQIQEEIVQVIRFVPPERIFEGIVERLVDVSEPHIGEQRVEMVEGHLSRTLATTHSGRDCGDAFCTATPGACGSGGREVPRQGRAEQGEDRGQESLLRETSSSRKSS